MRVGLTEDYLRRAYLKIKISISRFLTLNFKGILYGQGILRVLNIMFFNKELNKVN